MKSYFRKEIDAIAGYVPGEQPKAAKLVKLNTNENPYPPSPEVRKVLARLSHVDLRLYPDPMAELPVAVFEPSYSLYPVLAALQGAPVIKINLDKENFTYPENVVELAGNANLLIITRPNAPTGNCAPKELVEKICREFDGIVLIDEAYSDFAEDDCAEFAKKFDLPDGMSANALLSALNILTDAESFENAAKEISEGI